LIADDVADSGETLRLVEEFWRGTVKETRTAVLYEKPRSVVKPDYVWRKTDKWIEFPWSTGMPIK
jgi:hypoxanthine phosphoribosyltransferase